ncbi:MAG: proprotein convertase P-domain-containing protein [Pseudomonadota bacterium]
MIANIQTMIRSDAKSQSTSTTTRSARVQFFHTVGALAADRPGYIRRPADTELLNALGTGRFADLTGAPQVGKTSALRKAAALLQEQDDPPLVAFIDIRYWLQKESNEDIARWFYAIAYRIVRQLRASFDLQAWWSDHAMLNHHQRWLALYRELVLALPGRRIILIFDDVHELVMHDQSEALLTSFRAAFDARSADPEMSRLSIAFAHNGARRFGREHLVHLPYAISQHVPIEPMTLAHTLKLAPALGLAREQGELAMQRIYDWVRGQPAMTQWLASELAARLLQEQDTDAVSASIDSIVAESLRRSGGGPVHEAIARVERRVLNAGPALRESMLLTLGKLSKRGRLLFDPSSKAHDRLLLLDIVQLGPDGYILFASRLLRRSFSAGWANRFLPLRLGGLLRAGALVAALVASLVVYQVVLPAHHARQIMDANATVNDAIVASQRLAIWPGHAADAVRMRQHVLETRARQAESAADIAALSAAVEGQLGDATLAADLSANYWRKALARSQRQEDRIEALRAAAALVEQRDTPSNRRVLAGLVGTDLPALTGVLRSDTPFESLRFRPRDQALLTQSGTQVSEWRRADSGVWRRTRSQQPSAYQLDAQVARFELPAIRNPSRTELRMDIVHERLGDIRIVVTSPAGRRAVWTPPTDLADTVAVTVALKEMSGDSNWRAPAPAGVWTVVLADMRPGSVGEVSNLTLAASRSVATETVLLQDPQPVVPDALHIDARGRYAVAMGSTPNQVSGIWDLRDRRLIATLPLAQPGRWVGFAQQGRAIVLLDGDVPRIVQVSDGQPIRSALADNPVRQAWIDATGRWLTLRRRDIVDRVVLFDLQADKIVGSLPLADSQNTLAVSSDGRYLATAGDDLAVRVWDVAQAALIAETNTESAVSALEFGPANDTVLVREWEGGLLSWQFDQDNEPVRWQRNAVWSYANDPQTGLSLVGSSRDGFRLHDFSQRLDRSQPVLGIGSDDWRAQILRVRDRLVVMASAQEGLATIWQPRLQALPTGERRVRSAWLSPDGASMAFTDSRDAYAVVRFDAGIEDIDDLDDVIASIVHATPPQRLRFDASGRRVVSMEANGLYRVFDTDGRLLPFIGRGGRAVRDIALGSDGAKLLIATSRQIKIVDATTGRVLATQSVDAAITKVIALAPAQWLIVQQDGRLAKVSFNDAQANVDWRFIDATVVDVELGVANQNGLIVLASSTGLSIVSAESGSVSHANLALTSSISELVFAPDGRHLLVRAGQWLHRIRVNIRHAQPVDSRLMPANATRYQGLAPANRDGSAIWVLAGLDEPVADRIWFDYREQDAGATQALPLSRLWSLIDVM